MAASLSTSIHPALKAGSIAVITGGFSGIGAALAKRYREAGLSVCVGDNDESAMASVPDNIYASKIDVTDRGSLEQWARDIQEKFPEQSISVVHANAGVGGPSKASTSEGWDRIFNVNFHGVVNTVQTFLPLMSDGPGIIVATGSKQGITTPPGSGAIYNISKAATKVFTEQLSHELRQDKPAISVHLLIPGWVHTGLTGAKSGKPKPEGAWTPDQTAAFAFDKIKQRSFYILCPDNETAAEVDKARMEWNVEDIIQDRPALSRWHPEYKDQFAAFMKTKGL